jgi:hypothetical protein
MRSRHLAERFVRWGVPLDDGEAERGQLRVNLAHAALRLTTVAIKPCGGSTPLLLTSVEDNLHILDVHAVPLE